MKLPRIKPKEAIRRLMQAGFLLDHVRGSHYVLRHSETKNRVVVAFHHKELKPKTMKSILQQAGLSIEDFESLK